LAHGVTAAPLANRYGQRMADAETVEADTAEQKEVPEMPLRG